MQTGHLFNILASGHHSKFTFLNVQTLLSKHSIIVLFAQFQSPCLCSYCFLSLLFNFVKTHCKCQNLSAALWESQTKSIAHSFLYAHTEWQHIVQAQITEVYASKDCFCLLLYPSISYALRQTP